MLLPSVLVVFMISRDAPESTLGGFRDAATEVLGPAAMRVERVTRPLTDSAALERAGAADGVVELEWDGARQSVRLHCYIVNQQRWVDRTITFDPSDRESERGRLLGFAVASMLVNGAEPASEATAPQPQPATRAASSKLTDGQLPQSPASWQAAEPTSPAAGWEPLAGHALEFAGVVSRGFGGAAENVGASAALRFAVAEPYSLRLSLSGRAGEIPAAQASTRTLGLGLGLSWSILSPTAAVELELRADALGGWMDVAHLSADDIRPVRRQRWLFGGDALATLGYRLSPMVTIFAGGGLEAMLGETHIYTHGQEVATVPTLRGVAEAGFRTRF
jgi:hypothetical protein